MFHLAGQVVAVVAEKLSEDTDVLDLFSATPDPRGVVSFDCLMTKK